MRFLKKHKIAGFTLVELMVAVGIYILMAALLFANQNKFNHSLSFSNLGYDVALTIRQAQTYGFAVQGENNTSNGATSFSNAFGVHFDGSHPSSFILFYEPIVSPLGSSGGGSIPLAYDACTNSTKDPTCGAHQKTLSTYNLQNNYTIAALCNESGTGPSGTCGKTCYSVSSGGSANNYLDIIFQRPNINAFIFNQVNSSSPLPQASIELKSPEGEAECINVYSSGDIEVSTTTTALP